jgi:uncharacterized protein
MVYEIIIGRSKSNREKYGIKGSILLGKQYVNMGQVTSLSNPVYMDVTTSHVVFVCGKRGSGKSYTMGVVAEGMSELPKEISSNIAVVMLDTMGIYWTMKYPNKQDKEILEEWGIKPEALNIQIYTPKGFYKQFKKEGIPTDFEFSIKPSELSANDWCLTFGIDINSELGVFIDKIIEGLKSMNKEFDILDIINNIQKEKNEQKHIIEASLNRFLNAKSWGLFDKEGTPLTDLVKGGQVTVLDVSAYAITPGAEGIRALVIGLVSKKLFLERMIARKKEEYNSVHASTYSLIEKTKEKLDNPLVWLIIDEAHEFLPKDEKTTASDALITILREGRQPGISLILASQQPGKIHTDVMTQSDIVISHRVTAKIDVDALGTLMQSYMREGLDKSLNNLPGLPGSAVVFDDVNERIYPIRVRPRQTWHGGAAPSAMTKEVKKDRFSL